MTQELDVLASYVHLAGRKLDAMLLQTGEQPLQVIEMLFYCLTVDYDVIDERLNLMGVDDDKAPDNSSEPKQRW